MVEIVKHKSDETEILSINPNEVAENHPDYVKYYDEVILMRDSVEGEKHIKEVTVERNYLRIPTGLNPQFSENEMQRQIDQKNLLGYIYSANYPEVVYRTIDFAISMAMSAPYEIVNRPKEFTDDFLDNLDNKGRSFYHFVSKLLHEALTTRGGAIVQDIAEDGEVYLAFYNWESSPNRKYNNKGELKFAVLEEYVATEEDSLEHNEVKERIVVLRNPYDPNDKSIYTQRFRSSEEKTSHHQAIRSRVDRFFDNQRSYGPRDPNSYQPVTDLERTDFDFMPVEYLCSNEYKRSIYLALAKACMHYYKTSANLENALYHTANPTPYIKFTTDGDFYDSSNPGEDSDTDTLVIRKGTERPLIFREGDYKYAQVGDSGLASLFKAQEDSTEKIAALGAKSFSPKQATNVSAETQKIQTFSENSVVELVIGEVENTITRVLRNVARLKKINNPENIIFRFSNATGLEKFSSDDFPLLLTLYEHDIIPMSTIRNHARRTKFVADNITDEELDAMIQKERSKLMGLNFIDE